MDEKKEIGRKIWDLFSKGYSYGQIAKELNISKSVVSNIINYTLPPRDWCDKNLQNLKKQHKKEIELLKKKYEKNEKEIVDNLILVSSILIFAYSTFITITLFVLRLLNIITFHITANNIFIVLVKLAVISILLGSIIFFANKKLLKKLKNEI